MKKTRLNESAALSGKPMNKHNSGHDHVENHGHGAGGLPAERNLDDSYGVAGEANGSRKQLPAVHSRPGRQPARTGPALPDLYSSAIPEGAASPFDGGALDWRRYVGILNRNRILISCIAAICLSAGLAYTLLQTPTYRSSTTIQINREAANISGLDGLDSVEAGAGTEFYQSQYELLKSRALAERVVSTLGLANEPEFYRPEPSGWVKLRELVVTPEHQNPPDFAARQSMAVRAVVDGLTVEPVRFSSLVRVGFDSIDPKFTQQIADAVPASFIASNMERNYEASAYARNFLETRLKELALKLDDSERKLVTYAEEMDLLATGSDQSLTMTHLDNANKALGEVNVERLRHEVRWRQAEANDLSPVLETEAVGQLRAQRREQTFAHEDRMNFAPKAPDVARIEARIEEIDSQIVAEVDRIKESLKQQYEASLNEEQALLRQVDKLKGEVMDYQNRNIQYTILQREVDTNGVLYDGLLQRYKEVSVTDGVRDQDATTNISIVDRAQPPVISFTPRFSLNLAVSLLFGLLLGGATAIARDILDDSFHTTDELEDGLNLPIVGIIPFATEASDVVGILNDRRSFVSEAYRSLRTALLFSTAAGTPKSLVVTSACEGEGKSTASINLAAQSAKLGLRVLLVDADLHHPSLHRLLGCDGEVGLTHYLAGDSTLEEALQPTALSSLTLLACCPLSSHPAELLSGARMASLILNATRDFDLVVVDAPPIGGLADAPLLASMCDGTLLVVEAGKTGRKTVVAGLKRLQFANANVVGVVFNRFKARQVGYGYGYGNDKYHGYSVGVGGQTGSSVARVG